jgi:type IV secretion system protein VirD4
MIQLIALALIAATAFAVDLSWKLVWAFHSLEQASWKWVWDYTGAYGHIPWFLPGSIAGGFGFFIVAMIVIQLFAARVRSRSKSGDREAEELHGSAHFASKDEAKKTGLFREDGGVVVGGWPNATNVRPLRDDGPDHVLLVGGPRSGKGVGPILSTLLSWTGSVVVNDIRGENHGKSAGWQAKRGARVLKFSPAAMTGSARWNPLSEIRVGTDYEISDSQNIAMMVIDPDGTGLKDFWMKSGFAWLAATILHVLYRLKIEENRVATLADVSLFLSTPEGDFEDMLKDMRSFQHGRALIDQFVGASASEMLAAAHPERSGVHSSAKTELMLYRDPIIARNISTSDFCINDLQNGDQPVALYLVIPPNDLDRLRPLLRVFWNLLLRRLMQTYDTTGMATHKRQLLLMFDEFTSVKKLDIFEQALAYMGGYGIKAFLVVQDLMQVERIYGRENSILGLCRIKVAYAATEPRTAKILSELCGVSTVVHEKHEKNRKVLQVVGGNMTDRLENVQRPLMTPDECMRLEPAEKTKDGMKILKPGEMLTFVMGHPPIRGRQPLYFKDTELKRRAELSAPGDDRPASNEDGAPEAAGASIDDAEENQALPANTVPSITDRIRAAAQPNP